MARRKSRNNRSNKNQVKKNTLAKAQRNLARKVGNAVNPRSQVRGLVHELDPRRPYRKFGRAIAAIQTLFVSPSPEPARRANRTPPEQEIAKRKKPITKWSEVNLRLRCKDRPKNNKPKGAGGGQKEFVPWC